MGIETIPDTDYSLLLPPQVVAPTIVSGSTMSGETNTGISQTGSIINAGRTAQTETGNTQTGNNQTEPSVRDEIDTTTSKNDLIAADTGSTQNLPSTTLSSVMSISIG